ncbi:hypothetical protein O181_039770 [Austropuccinia psidii MF-1]|uniref:Uncharacterized protein n=1 Tax=Austropuccinia psidii MF-1 TaxID=1389203 RepID=A0A9Q3DC31_9BASI|nr:hypothetical protein [Austropuccinia psidii MF-1]
MNVTRVAFQDDQPEVQKPKFQSYSHYTLKCFSLSYPLSPLHPPSKNTRSQRNPAFFTPTGRVLLDCTPSFGQTTTNGRSSTLQKGGIKSRRSRSSSGLLSPYLGMSEGARARLGEAEDEEGEESAEEENSGKPEVADALAKAPEVPRILI